MSYKICSRCRFLVPPKRHACTTCGGNSFHYDDEQIHSREETNGRGNGDVGSSALRARPDSRQPHMVAVAASSASEERSRQAVLAYQPGKMADRDELPSPVTAMPQLGAGDMAFRSSRNASAALREKFNFEQEELPVVWWEETWTKVKRTLNW